MTYGRLDAGTGPRRLPHASVLAELARILGVSAEAIAGGIAQARSQRSS